MICCQLCPSCVFFPSLCFLPFPFYPFLSLVSFLLCSLSLAVTSLMEWWLSALLGAAAWPCQLLCIIPLSLELSQGSTWCGICSVDFCIKEIRIMLTKTMLCKALIWQRESPWRCNGFILHLFNLGFIHHTVNFPVGYTGLLCFNCKLYISMGSEWWRCVRCTWKYSQTLHGLHVFSEKKSVEWPIGG